MSGPRNMLFLSHATPEDNQFTTWLALRLAAEGYPVWCDLTKLLGGEPFWKEIESAIRDRTAKFIFVLSKHSNAKEGCLDELEVASTVRKQLKDDHFIIPLRIDDLSFSETNIRIHKLNVVDFTSNWMTGFQRLIERLKDDGIQKDPRFGNDAVSIWWRQHFGEEEGVSEKEDFYLTNRLEISSLPRAISLIGLEAEPSTELNPDDSPFPVAAHKTILISFATSRELLPFIEKNKLHFGDGHQQLDLETFLEKGLHPVIEPKTARNTVSYLLRQGFGRLAKAKGLSEYALSNNRKTYWFSHGTVENDKITFRNPDGASSWKAMVGYKTIKAREKATRIRNWHFGIEAFPRVGFERYFSVLPHVVFSEEGVLYESSKRQHASRRNQCASWYNDDWRDRILAALWHLSNGTGTISIPLAESACCTVAAYPEVIVSPVSYLRTVDIPIEVPDEDDFDGEEIEEPDDE